MVNVKMQKLISSKEINYLISLKKVFSDSKKTYQFPSHGGKISIPLVSQDKKIPFDFDINRKSISLYCTFQNRAFKTIVLVRLDFGAPHRNPDGQEIASPHIHIWNEDYGDKIAYEVPKDAFSNLDDMHAVLYDFMKYCNIDDKYGQIKEDLFSK